MSEEQKNNQNLDNSRNGRDKVDKSGTDFAQKDLKKIDQKDDFSNFKVNRKGFIEVDGEVIETLPSITFRVRLENDYEILARLSGRMRMNRIMLLPGDKVKVEISPYDLTKGRITYRY